MQTRRFVSIVATVLLLVPPMAPGLASAQVSTGVSAVADVTSVEIPSQNAEDLLSPELAPSQEELTPVEIKPVEIPDLRPTDELVPADEGVKPAGDPAAAVEGGEGEGESPLLTEEDGSYISTPQPQRLAGIPKSAGSLSADPFTGSATYSYQFQLPEGRAGLTPNLVLRYSSASRTKFGRAGAHGWDFEVGHVERTTRYGVNNLFSPSSTPTFILHGAGGGSQELVPLSLDADGIHGTYGSEVEQSFDLVTFSSTTDAWTVLDRNGVSWTYGSSTDAREYNPTSTDQVSSWYISDAVGPTGATMHYSYGRDMNALIPGAVVYGGQVVDGVEEAGPFSVVIAWGAPTNEESLSYLSGYPIVHRRQLQWIEATVDGTLRSHFTVGASSLGSNGTAYLINSVQETRYSLTGTAVTMPATTFSYHSVPTTTWGTVEATTTAPFPLAVASCHIEQGNPVCVDTNATVADVDGDSRQDVLQVQSDAGGGEGQFHLAAMVYFLQSDGTWRATSSWDTLISPVGRPNEPSFGQTHAMDVNGDSRADFVISRKCWWNEGCTDGIDRRVYLNNGHGWTLSNWQVPVQLNNQYGASEVLVGDFNGDGLPDFASSSAPGSPNNDSYTASASSDIFYGTGSGWVRDASATVPFALRLPGSNSFMYGNETPKLKLMELNGDGLVDVVYSWQIGNQAPQRAVFINTGHGWVPQPPSPWGAFENWYRCDLNGGACGVEGQAPSSPAHSQVLDLNGDGIDDVLYTYSANGTADLRPGVVNRSAVVVSHNLPELDVVGASRSRFGDFTGDGQLDLGWGYVPTAPNGEDYRRYLQIQQPDYLLQTVTEPTGAATTLGYTEAHQYYDAASSTVPLNTALPYAVWTPTRVTVAPGNGQPNQVTDYTYEGGAAAWASSTDREFAGFWKVTATSGDTKTTTEFHQGIGGLPLTTSTQLHADRGQYQDEASKRGRPYRTELRNASTGALLSSDVTKWESATLAGEGRKFVYPSLSTSFVAKANGQLDATAVERTFDTSNGNELATYSYGSVAADPSTGEVTDDLGSDYSLQEKQYASSSGSRILGAPKLAKVRDETDTVIAEKEIRYDGLPLGQVSQGKPTRVEDKLPSSAVYAIYDTYANVAASSDPRGATTTFSYDAAYHLVPTASTNPLGQTNLQQVDLATRQVASSTDANGANERWIRDGFGRPLERWVQNPDAVGTLLAERWTYGDSARPVWVRHEVFRSASDIAPGTDYAYADGAGRVIQTRALEDPSTFIISDTLYDAQGRVARQSLPYRGNGSSYATPSSTVPSTTYAYDAAGRVTTVFAPAGNTSVAYDGLVTRVTDALGRVAEQERDGRGRLVRVTRWLSSQPVTYSYTWDAAGRLTGMQDPGGNTREFTYDGQGRLLTQTDWHATSSSPDVWAYAYDATGNVTSSTDPRGVTITSTYDSLNRVTAQNDTSLPGIEQTYTYDGSGGNHLGRLRSATTPKLSTSYSYDRLGRATTVDRTFVSPKVGYVQRFRYDLTGAETARFEPNGYGVVTEYDRMGRWNATSWATGTISELWSAATSSALVFSGYQYAEAADHSSMDVSSGGLTIEAWVRYDGVPLPNSASTILSKGNGQVGYGGNYLFQITENDTLILYRSPGNYVESPTLGDAGDGWHHYAVAFDGGPNSVQFYRDGQPFGGQGGLPDLVPNDLPLRIGWTYDQASNEVFYGSIAEVRLWNVARTTAQLAESYNRHTGGTGLVAYWCMGEGAGTTSADCSPSGYDLHLASSPYTPQWTSQGPQVRHFMGTDATTVAATLSYTPLGQLESVLYGNGLVTRDTYTPADGYRLARRTTGEEGSYLQDLNYEYDAVGNVTSLVDASQAEPLGSDRTFAYDDLDRLVGVQGTYSGGENLDASSTFSYDTLGNMHTRGDYGLYRLMYNDHPYRPSHAVVGGDGLLGFQWDAAGSLVEVGSNLYQYDGFGRLGTSTYGSGDGDTARDAYAYDHAGARAYRTHDILGDELDPAATYSLGTYEQDLDGVARLFLDAPGRRLAQVTVDPSGAPSVTYLHPDALGSSPLATAPSGDPAALVDQDPYGLPRFTKLPDGGPAPTRSYTGKELDPSQWYYFGARYYTPEMARFTQVDPLTLSLGTMRPAELNRILSDPQRYLHPYAYAANNPLKYVDQNGQFPILVPLAAMAVALGGAVWAMPDVARSGYYAVTGDYAAAGESSDRALAKEAIAFAVLGTAIASAEAFVGAAAANQSARQATAPQAQTTGAIAQNRLRFAPGVDTHISQGRINSQGTIVGGHMWNQEAEELVQRVNGTVRIGSNGVRVAQYSDMNGNLRVKTYLPDWFTDRDAAVVKAQLLTQAPQGNNVVTQYRGIQFRGLVSDNQINSWYPVNPLPR